jgi:hypothetical protein
MSNINFSNWEAKKVVLHHYDSTMFSLYGCGACALALLTGISPKTLYLQNSFDNPNWPIDKVLRILRDEFFEIQEITNEGVKKNKTDIDMPISSYHPILTVQKMTKSETSFQFIYNNLVYHNFETRPLKPMEFLNNPIVKAYLIIKDEWRDNSSKY